MKNSAYNKLLQRTCKTVTRFAQKPAKQAPVLQAAEQGVQAVEKPLKVLYLRIFSAAT